MDGARGVLFNIVGGADLTMTEVDEAAKIITSAADPDANIIFGATIDESMHDQIRITIVATGFDQAKQRLQQFVINNEKEEEVPQVTHPTDINVVPPSAPQQAQPQEEKKDQKNTEDEWDIPAFLRQRN
jgi:cell division protein FtsZ